MIGITANLENAMIVVVCKETATGCWECFSHAADSGGYPSVKYNGRLIHIHRLLFLKRTGITAQVVRHTCDNRMCINPDHLLPGTHADNVADRVKRGRGAFGTQNGRSKLNDAKVLEIIADKTTSNSELARRYGVNSKVIRLIRIGKTWKHVPRS